MALYCYICDETGDRIERKFPFGKPAKTVRVGTKVYRRDWFTENKTRYKSREKLRTGGNRFRPGIAHNGWGVMPFQRAEYAGEMKRRGLKTEIDEQGDPVFYSQRGYDDFVRSMHSEPEETPAELAKDYDYSLPIKTVTEV